MKQPPIQTKSCEAALQKRETAPKETCVKSPSDGVGADEEEEENINKNNYF